MECFLDRLLNSQIAERKTTIVGRSKIITQHLCRSYTALQRPTILRGHTLWEDYTQCRVNHEPLGSPAGSISSLITAIVSTPPCVNCYTVTACWYLLTHRARFISSSTTLLQGLHQVSPRIDAKLGRLASQQILLWAKLWRDMACRESAVCLALDAWPGVRPCLQTLR